VSESAFDIFCRVVDLDPPSRSVELTSACDGDDSLRREVESLLHAHDTAGASFLVGSALHAASANFDGLTRDRAGEILGPYRLLREIGAGGMGSVWLAERADGEFDHHVAVKLIRRGMDTDDILARFRQERQVLARLQHPNIAGLLDGGSTGEGLPFLVMEHVEGTRIDRCADEHRLTIGSRIRLFLNVCDAVQYAHRNLVIHRDLKPGNILVTKDGVPKLLDFGVAKVLQGSAEGGSAPTETIDRRLTPAYASPEQVRGEVVSTSTDVYSLGVVLYELLCGRRPYAVDDRSARDLERAITDGPPSRPGAALSGTTADAIDGETSSVADICRARSTDRARLARLLRGDIETILLKAIRKEPERRYSSVEAFADDLRRYLDGRPVTARPDSLVYRATRFTQRNRAGVAAGGLAIVALTAAAVLSTSMFFSARRAEQRAVSEAATATTVASYLEDMIGSIDPAIAQGKDVTILRGVLDETAERLSRELDDSPHVASSLHRTVGKAYHAIGDYVEAERHLAQAVRLRREQSDAPLETAAALHDRARTLRELGRYDEGLAALEEARDLRSQELGEHHALVGASVALLGDIFWASGDYERGETELRAGIDILRSATDHDPRQLAAALRALGGLLSDQRRPQEAEPLLLESRNLYARTVGEWHPSIAAVESALGWCSRRSGRLQDAADHYSRSLEIYERVLDADHPSIAYSRTGLASVLEDLGRYDEAEQLYLQALDVVRSALGEQHVEFGTVCNNLGNLYAKTGRPDDAVPFLLRAVENYTDVRGPDDEWTSFPWANLARAYLAMDEWESALDAANESLRIRRGSMAPDRREIIHVESMRGAALTGLGRLDEAEQALRRCYDMLTEHEDLPARLRRQTLERLVRLAEVTEDSKQLALWRSRLDEAGRSEPGE